MAGQASVLMQSRFPLHFSAFTMNGLVLGLIFAVVALGFPVLLGVSRKSFIGRLDGDRGPDERLGGSIAGALWGASRGVAMVRVHDVRETVQALKVWEAIGRAG